MSMTHTSSIGADLAKLLRAARALWQQPAAGLRLPDALRALVAAGRAALNWRRHVHLQRLSLVQQRIARHDPSEALFPVSHRHFLCQGLSAAQRIDAAIHHVEHEQRSYSATYFDAVYGASGLQLWTETVGPTTYRMALVANRRLRHEGPLTLELWGGARRLCEVSFAWTDARLFDRQGLGTVPFVTRNQSVRGDCAELVQFRKDFPNHSPVYFCMAALQGLARLSGCQGMAAIRHAAQISYLPQYKAGFENSYCALWAGYGAEDLDSRAWLIAVPPRLADLADVKSKHRKRALERRTRWEALTQLTMDAVQPFVRPVDRRKNGPRTISYGSVPRTQSRPVLVTGPL